MWTGDFCLFLDEHFILFLSLCLHLLYFLWWPWPCHKIFVFVFLFLCCGLCRGGGIIEYASKIEVLSIVHWRRWQHGIFVFLANCTCLFDRVAAAKRVVCVFRQLQTAYSPCGASIVSFFLSAVCLGRLLGRHESRGTVHLSSGYKHWCAIPGRLSSDFVACFVFDYALWE